MQTRRVIVDLFKRWTQDVTDMQGSEDCRGYFQQELPLVLHDPSLIVTVLEAVVKGADYPDVGASTMFDSEIVLYRDPGRAFSVRLYLWGPGEYDPVHDHNSWGVIGTAVGTLDVTRYICLDDGVDDGRAVLEEVSRHSIPRGGTCSVYPLERGIHRTGNAGGSPVVQVGVYGRNLTGREYVLAFDTSTSRVSRLYLPHVKKRMLAREALDACRGEAGPD
jgi:predicted metal-dependent enzyme (double-stranded beta helix superfamily)